MLSNCKAKAYVPCRVRRDTLSRPGPHFRLPPAAPRGPGVVTALRAPGNKALTRGGRFDGPKGNLTIYFPQTGLFCSTHYENNTSVGRHPTAFLQIHLRDRPTRIQVSSAVSETCSSAGRPPGSALRVDHPRLGAQRWGCVQHCHRPHDGDGWRFCLGPKQ